MAAVSVLCLLGDYAGSATALVTDLAPAHLLGRALARFQLPTGFDLAVSPRRSSPLSPPTARPPWGSPAAATLLSAAAVAR